MRRLRELSEAECYARCYGAGDDAVRVLWDGHVEAHARPLSGEAVRLLFAAREPERAAGKTRAPVPAVAAS